MLMDIPINRVTTPCAMHTLSLMQNRYTFGNAWRLGIATLRARYASLLLLSIAAIAIGLLLAAPQYMTRFVLPDPRGAADSDVVAALAGSCFLLILSVALNVLVAGPLLIGVVYASAQATTGAPQVSDLFIGFRSYGTVIGSYLLVGAIYAGCILAIWVPFMVLSALVLPIIAQVATGSAFAALFAGIAIAVVLFLVLMARVVMRVVLAPIAAVDPTLGPMRVGQAFRLSWDATKGLGASMLALAMLSGLIAAIGPALLVVGYYFLSVPLVVAVVGIALAAGLYILVGVPLLYAMMGAMYQLVIRNTRTATESATLP